MRKQCMLVIYVLCVILGGRIVARENKYTSIHRVAAEILAKYVKEISNSEERKRYYRTTEICDIRSSEPGVIFRVYLLNYRNIRSATAIEDILIKTNIYCFPVIACGEEWAQMEITNSNGEWKLFRFGGGDTAKKISRKYQIIEQEIKKNGDRMIGHPAIFTSTEKKISFIYTKTTNGE